MATHAAARPRPRCHGDAGSPRVPEPPRRSSALALHLLRRRQLLKPVARPPTCPRSHAELLALASFHPLFRKGSMDAGFGHLLLGRRLPKSDHPHRKPTDLSQHSSALAGGLRRDRPPRPELQWKRSHEAADGELGPGGCRREGPCALLICTTKGGTFRPLGSETANRSRGYLPGQSSGWLQSSEGVVGRHVSQADERAVAPAQRQARLGPSAVLLFALLVGRGGRWERPRAVSGRRRLNFLLGLRLPLPPTSSQPLAVAYS